MLDCGFLTTNDSHVRASSANYGPVGIQQEGFGWSRSLPLLAGDRGTEQTIALIRQVVWDGLEDPRVHAQLAGILQGVPAYNDPAAVQTIYQWVLRHIRFTNDPVGHETIRSAHWILTYRIGDCDDINAVLLPTLLMSAGYPVELVTVASDPADPESFTHIYARVLLNGRWIPIDAARPGAQFGTAVRSFGRERVWSLKDEKYQDVAGLAGYPVALAGMGFSLSDFGNLLQSGTQAAGNILRSISSGGQVVKVPPVPGQTYPPYSTGAGIGGISMGTILLVGLGVGALVLLSRK